MQIVLVEATGMYRSGKEVDVTERYQKRLHAELDGLVAALAQWDPTTRKEANPHVFVRQVKNLRSWLHKHAQPMDLGVGGVG